MDNINTNENGIILSQLTRTEPLLGAERAGPEGEGLNIPFNSATGRHVATCGKRHSKEHKNHDKIGSVIL